jgi:hypothetical protein
MNKEIKDFKELSNLKNKYFHELTDAEMQRLYNANVQIGWLVANIKQPNWCTYPDALQGKMGCWSLMDVDEKRKKISEDFCKNCECFEKSS